MPAYNEQDRIAGCIAGARAHLEKLGNPYEIFVVDNGRVCPQAGRVCQESG